MNSSVILDNICLLVHKICQLKHHHSEITYLMTRNMIFSAVILKYIHLGVEGLFALHLQHHAKKRNVESCEDGVVQGLVLGVVQ